MVSRLGINGVGIDIVEVGRIEQLAEKWGEKFLDRVFTEKELEYCLSNRRRYEHLAGRFAVKEAVVKTFGRKLPWRSIEIDSGRYGRPVASIDLSEEEVEVKEGLHVSITHLVDYALAIAVIEG